MSTIALDDTVRLRPIVELAFEGARDPQERAIAYAALTLLRLLSPTWTHMAEIKEGKTTRYETVTRPAGRTFGDRAELQRRLNEHLSTLFP